MPLILSAPPEPPAISFFGDSSSRDSAYMVAGGIAVAGNRIAEIEDRIATLRADAGIRSEFHWSAYRGCEKKISYEDLIRYGFDLISKRKAALHVIIVPFKGYDHKANEGETKDTSINRMYFQLLLHRVARFYGRTRAIHVRFDAGNDCRDICKMRVPLCSEAYKRYATKPNCVRSIEPVDSKNVGLIQLVDVLIGAIATKANGVVHASPKGDLSDFVQTASGRHSWSSDTLSSARFLTVWHHKTKTAVRQVP